ncbi:hypothetical protein V1J52_06760 [Streptomyces sp. TRM 70351]|uniref:hypothetical protein n=1 Tax=Streptomyces sp. TRM 70351 TaxID=3116552 RepID=UPI002E7BE34B|nr:hypothetical protein [Streptomyces sp. TRM 70351]MEE1927895.1 hypothetical protein [Streptomyces sp. TRM 70351]
MASNPRHARPRPRRLLRAGLTLSAAAAAALGAAGSAQADAPAPSASGLDATAGMVGDIAGHALRPAVKPVTDLRLYPLAGTGTDPLDNAVGTQVADFRPVSTADAAAPVTEGGASLDSLLAPVGRLLPR